MKVENYSLAFVTCLAFTVGCWAQADVTDELSRALALVRSSNSSQRINGFRQLAEIWKIQAKTELQGFSDTPVKDKPEAGREIGLSDESVDMIAKAIEQGLSDEDAKVRESAAIAICSAPRSCPAVLSAITVGMNSEDSSVTWYTSRQASKFPPPIDSVIDSLIVKLTGDAINDFLPASDLLKTYGPQAEPYAVRIVDAVLQSKTNRQLKMYVLYDISLKGAAAKKLANAAKQLTTDELGVAAVSLLDHPDLLKQMESERPDVIKALQQQLPRLYPFLCNSQLTPNETRDWLASSNELLPATMGLLREKRFIDRITMAEKSASSYRKTFLAACKRACGADTGKQIMVDADHPVLFRPDSAWPKSDIRRISKTAAGHGDGGTFVMLTGEVRGSDGTHPKSIQFRRVNDAMLLGTAIDAPEDILYDPTTGRFVFYALLFAAFTLGNDQQEPGPYQTGSAQIRIEADGNQPLTLQFYDEMPDVVITLSPRSND